MVIEILRTIWYFIKYSLNGGWSHWAFALAMAVLAGYGLGLWAGVQAAPAIYTQLVKHLGFDPHLLTQLGITPDKGGMVYTAMSDSVAWGMYISFFVFWVGVAAAGVLFGIAAYGFRDKGFMRLAPLAEVQAVAAVLVALTLVFVDVGRPLRTILLMAVPIMEGHPPNPKSIFTYDFLVLNSYLIINLIGVFLAVHWYRRGPKYEPPKWLMYAFMVIAAPLAIGIHTVTGFISQALTARPIWLGPLLAPRYVATALAAGPAFLLIVSIIAEKFYKNYKVPKYVYEKTLLASVAALIVGLYFTLSETQELFWYTTEPAKRAQAIGLYMAPFVCSIMKPLAKDYLTYFAGSDICHWGYPGMEYLAMLFWAWVVLGVLAALLTIFVPPLRKSYKGIVFLSTLIILAVVAEKTFTIVIPGYAPDTLGVLKPYFPTPLEVAITIASHAVGLLVYVLLARPVLKAVEAHYGQGHH
ncbi:polysulfide reductase [Ignicoccus islandicus DSM 13165]|uniref:Polysulfide reductase n=1 Tax=Ignicoccus islandicus DSM 13165 TaxID=940295 RepID=A0A0U3DWY1_9CREN|nr:NrfD/PsrC family molybdoenzyme membrane anchor subunit [Ignicoccus islandicus]ALU12010.1 polysulfide reductase [Ignicoccus islandicus DSM 13165]